MEYTATDTDYSSMVGLTHTDSDMNYVSIDFAIFPQSGVVSVYESGVSRGSFGSFVVGDKFRVSVEGGVVKYRKNGTLVYTSTVSPTYPLVADASLYLNGRSVSNAVISVMENEAISWTNAAGVTVSGNTLTKTAATGWANAGASSAQSIVSGDGYVEYTATDTDYSSMVGLTHTDSDMNYVSIDFAIFPQSGVVSVYESGVSRGSFGNYVVGDKFRVSVEGGVVKYRKNGTLVYTSTVSPTYPLVADASLYLNGRSVSNAVISGNLSIPVSYVLQDIQGSTRAVMRSNQITARHDFLPFGEELGAGTGLRTTAQGYGATDKIRQRYGLTERDDTSGLDHTWWRKYENLAGRWTSADPYRGSMGVANPQSFNRYAYVGNDPVNLADPTGLEAPLVCLVDGIQVNCVTAFNLVHSGAGVFGPVNMSRWDSSARMGAGEWQFYRSIFGQGSGWFNLAGVSIDIHSWVNGEYAGGASYYESFGTYSFGGNPFVQIGPNRPTGSERRTPDRPKKRPCRPTGSGDIGGELITPVLLGPRAGVQLDDAGAYPYWGLAAGTVGKGVSITAGTRPVTPGISIGFSVFAVVGFSFQSGDLTTLGFRNALRQGSWHFGGGTPGASANITVTHYPPRFMRRIWACE